MKKLFTFKKKVHGTSKKIKKFCTNFAKFGKSESLASLTSLTTLDEKWQKIETVPTEFSVGERCTALHYEDSTWYNAKVEAIIEDGTW